jgi:RimJ/RimL family protein N-acetyltransferase
VILARCLTDSMPFPPMPLRLETQRLILTPEDEHDVEWFAELLNERGTHRFTVDDALEKITTMAATTAADGIGALVLRTRAGGDAIGYCALIIGRGSLAEPEIAYELLPRAHGQGYATEASRALLDAAFATGRTRIWSTVASWNAPSLRVLDKLGFRRDHSTADARGELIWLVCDR